MRQNQKLKDLGFTLKVKRANLKQVKITQKHIKRKENDWN